MSTQIPIQRPSPAPTDPADARRRRLVMLLVIFSSAALATACNTIEGAGEDLEETGENVGEASRDVRN